LSYSNRTTVAMELELLNFIYSQKKYDSYKVLLAIPNEEGTLSHRLTEFEGRMYAKTGTLVSSPTATLAGYVEVEGGVILFSVFSNGVEVSLENARKRIDSMVRLHVHTIERETARIEMD
jgi:D-alanyl-D-alanine carboxypeptidase